jgi:hypothetical protein
VSRQEISKWSTVCSTFSRSGWSVVRSASLAKGGTSKKDRHSTSTKFRFGVLRWVHVCKQPLIWKLVIRLVSQCTSEINSIAGIGSCLKYPGHFRSSSAIISEKCCFL